MLQISVNHLTENGLIDYALDYEDRIEDALKDINKIKIGDHFRVSVYDDKECTQIEATYYTLDYFIKLYGGEKWYNQLNLGKKEKEENQKDQVITKSNFTI